MFSKKFFTARAAVLLAAFGSALAISSPASADVTYRWVGADTNQGYGQQVQFEITLSDKNAFAQNTASCTLYGAHPCQAQPDSDLVSLGFRFEDLGPDGWDVLLTPRTDRAPFSGWDIDVAGTADGLAGNIYVFTMDTNFRLSSAGGLWTMTEFGNDRNTPIEDGSVSGVFVPVSESAVRRVDSVAPGAPTSVPEPGTLGLSGLALAVLGGMRGRKAKPEKA